jgi:hypothetical protein
MSSTGSAPDRFSAGLLGSAAAVRPLSLSMPILKLFLIQDFVEKLSAPARFPLGLAQLEQQYHIRVQHPTQ